MIAHRTTRWTGAANCFIGLAALLCLVFCPPACSADARFSDGKSAVTIPFELDNNLIYVRMSVNGSRPLSFILDTGAYSFIHTRHARTIGLKLKLIGKAGGAGAKQPDVYLVTEKVSFSLPGVVFSPPRLVAVSLDAAESCVNEFNIDEEGRKIDSDSSKESGAKRELDGILGKEFFDQFVVEIDYAQRLLNVYDRSSYKYAGGGKEIPLEVGEQHIFVRAQIRAAGRDPITGRFLLDTGSAQALSLMKPFVNAHNLLPSTEGMSSLPACGLGGHANEKSWLGTSEALQLGEFKITAPVTEFRMSEPNTDADGFIGGAVFRRFKVIFDYSRRRMILEPRSDLSK
ncbi:MAG TPA: aspartyl protease family protein [Pyrinomonadaceae bacterium]|nr:aspartyl protease family protein [Pyrinomonadaceae bacterium]